MRGGRSGGRSRVAFAALASATLACGNSQRQEPVRDVAPAADTLRGRVTVTGAEPVTQLTLVTTDGRAFRLEGAVADRLRRVNGLEVWVAGRDVEGAVQVDAFRVRGLDGMPARDGVLETDGGAVVLVTPGGERIRYPRAPNALRGLAGQHVWIAGTPGAAPEQWGVIRPEP